MSILIVIISILLMLVLIFAVKLNAFLSLIIASLFVGITQGMDFADIINSLQHGIGSTLGSLILIIAFGVILGNILSDRGAVQRIRSGLISFLIWTDICFLIISCQGSTKRRLIR